MFIPSVSDSAKKVSATFYYIFGIEVFLLILVTFFMILFIIKYRKKKNPHPENIEGSLFLEVIWTIIPTILVLIMFYVGLRGFIYIRKVPEEVMVIKVTARQWSWLFKYENGRQSDMLRVPFGKPVKLLLTSEDVIHCLYIPAFRIKEDCVPGMETYLWFTPDAIGTYDIFCTEYCGLGHSGMLSKAIVMSEKDFETWYAVKKVEGKKVNGLRVLQERGCLGCHSIDGTPKIGPTLKGIFGRKVKVLTAGKERTIIVDEEYIRRSILEPQADIVKGFPAVMPVLPLSKEDVDGVIEYLKILK